MITFKLFCFIYFDINYLLFIITMGKIISLFLLYSFKFTDP